MHEDAPVVFHGTWLGLGEMCEWHVVVAECWKCRHQAEIPQSLLKRRRPLSMTVDDVAFHLRCSKRGMGGTQRISVRQLPRNC